jgi:predicted Zn-dependent protease
MAKQIKAFAASVALAALVAAVPSNAQFMSRSAEKRIGAQEHPKMMAEFGGPYKVDAISGYVAQVGGRMAANSDWPNEAFTMTLLNSKVINAFALPGGYVYISRQLLGLMNDEAELASVLGHEVGHVTARHSAKRYDRQMWGQLATIGAAVLGGGQWAQLIGQGTQLYTLSYSRNQEFQADDIGVRTMARAGYDPFAAADMLRSLGAQDALDQRLMGRDANAQQTPTWARTHPLTGDRVTRAVSQARATKVAEGATPRRRDEFLRAIDGLLMDDDAEQGFVRGRTFSHPKLGMTFTAPNGFYLTNTNEAVIAQSQQGQAIFSGGKLAEGESLDNYLGRVWTGLAGQQAPRLPQAQPTRINNLDAAVTATQVQRQNGRTLNVALVAYRWGATDGYHFVFISPAELGTQMDGQFREMANSMRRLTAEEAGRLTERKIRVVTVGSGDTAESLSRRMAYTDMQMDRFLVLNRLSGPNDLRAGQKVKLIVDSK